ncbi:MAG: isocitrate lyase/phosphoenolpyruvate mutase family protein [Burkholderiales bacterium]|nr:isocitrate lyase/phosphoenolpyruvate mutase family protein [Burkholderiales bacterium]
MSGNLAVERVALKAAALRELHARSTVLILPNAWDAASARAFEKAGFAAVATTSGGVAAAIGYKDHEDAPAAEMVAAAARIARAVDIPVSVDFEAGYRLAPERIAEQLIAAGAAGCNLEDSDYHGPGGVAIVSAERQAEHLAAVKAALRKQGADLFLNARVDVFVRKLGTPEEQLAEGLRRARLYRAAGADCIYPIMLADEAMIAEFVRTVGVVNVNIRRGGALTAARAATLGVRRITYASSIFREAMTFIEGIGEAIKVTAAQAGG